MMRFASFIATLAMLASPILISGCSAGQQADTGCGSALAQAAPFPEPVKTQPGSCPIRMTSRSDQVPSWDSFDPYQPHDGLLPNGLMANPPGFP
jgi:hypothetical protein